jgi:hypothetical protein
LTAGAAAGGVLVAALTGLAGMLAGADGTLADAEGVGVADGAGVGVLLASEGTAAEGTEPPGSSA